MCAISTYEAGKVGRTHLICLIKDIPVFYEEYGEGMPILFIHGWTPDHRMMKGCFEPVLSQTSGYRRIYIGLPGMGQTPARPWIRNSDDMLDILCEFIYKVIGNENFLLAGCSYGGYLTLGLIHKLGHKIAGALFLVAMTDSLVKIDTGENLSPKHRIWQSKLLSFEEESNSFKAYMDMAIIATPEMYSQWLKDIQPGLDIADKEFTANESILYYSPALEESIRNLTFDKPSTILAGRQDGPTCCYIRAYELAKRFTRATFAALDGAGHILQIDNEPLFQQLVKDWLWRVELNHKTIDNSLESRLNDSLFSSEITIKIGDF